MTTETALTYPGLRDGDPRDGSQGLPARPEPLNPEPMDATFDRLFAANVRTPYFLVGALAPKMAELFFATHLS
jgi:hypothetical protein